MKKTSLFMLILCTFLTPRQSRALDVYKIFLANRFDMNLDAQYFRTASNFSANGDKQSLPANSELKNINLLTSARYLFFSDLGLYSGLNFGNVESNNGINTRTNSVLTHYFLGADYQLIQSETWSLYTDVSYLLSNEHIDVNGDVALASDGASAFKTLFVGIVQLESSRSFAKVGYTYRTEGLSSLLLYGLGVEFLMGGSAIGAELDGFGTIKDDQQTNSPLVRDTLTNRVNAGSRKYFSVNPNLLDGQLYYSYAFDPDFILKLSAGATVLGSNSADGYFAGLSVNWGFGGRGRGGNRLTGHRSEPSKKVINNSSLPDSEPGFKIETDDGVNQDLFKSAEPVPKKK